MHGVLLSKYGEKNNIECSCLKITMAYNLKTTLLVDCNAIMSATLLYIELQ